MRIFVDIDETICFYDGVDRLGYKNAIPDKKNITTARGSYSGIDYFEITKNQIEKWGCKYHNLSVGEKPAYDLLICDKTKRIEEI